MINRKTALKIRKAHRYLGIFLGIQFLLWTISGLYFSWTDIDEIHGDHFRAGNLDPIPFSDLVAPGAMGHGQGIYSLVLRDIGGTPYYWINDQLLVNARTGTLKEGISQDEAVGIVQKQMREGIPIKSVEKLETVDAHHEYRGRPLPVYRVAFEAPEELAAYVSVRDGSFQTVRHRAWRWFDFLWMTHTMDYEGRDNFNTTVLRVFSLMGLVTVLSGFLLFFTSSPTLRKLRKKPYNKR